MNVLWLCEYIRKDPTPKEPEQVDNKRLPDLTNSSDKNGMRLTNRCSSPREYQVKVLVQSA
jgi:hypothetical protein